MHSERGDILKLRRISENGSKFHSRKNNLSIKSKLEATLKGTTTDFQKLMCSLASNFVDNSLKLPMATAAGIL